VLVLPILTLASLYTRNYPLPVSILVYVNTKECVLLIENVYRKKV
jgi:hypothetical protein